MQIEELPGVDSPELPPGRRWRATEDGAALGEVTAWLRPDDRLFLTFEGSQHAYAALADAVSEAANLPLHVSVDAARTAAIDALTGAGFAVDYVEERFRVRFDAALALLRRASLPAGFALRSAAEVDERRLLALDDELRQQVPGTDGWEGSLRLLREALESPSFDPRGYLVAFHDREPMGLARIWRNEPEPRFGMVSVSPRYRHTLLGPALLRHALTAAAEWGSPTFTGETSVDNTFVFPKLKRVGAETLGRTLFLVRPGGAVSPSA